jgi:hypothetical protein
LVWLLTVRGNAWAFDENAQAKGFAQALATMPLPLLALWSARAYHKCVNLTEAMAMYDVACKFTPNELWVSDKQQNAQVEARDELELLRQRIPRVVIEVPALDGGEVRVTIDDNALIAAEYGKERFVNPGPHVIVYDRANVRTERRIVASEKQVQVARIEETSALVPTPPVPNTGKPLEGTRGDVAVTASSSAVLPRKRPE